VTVVKVFGSWQQAVWHLVIMFYISLFQNTILTYYMDISGGQILTEHYRYFLIDAGSGAVRVKSQLSLATKNDYTVS
jgi:hypothetical protein